MAIAGVPGHYVEMLRQHAEAGEATIRDYQ